MCAKNQYENSAPENITDALIVVVYPSWTMKNALASLINLLTLLIGITIGIILAPHLERPAHALGAEPQVALSTTPPSGPEQITPQISAGNAAVYLFLAHHIQSDELVVNGIDMLKLQQGEVNLLSRIPGVNPLELQGIVNSAKDTHLYQVAPQPKSQQPPAK
ncbi:MAG: hypothetical protein WCA10_22695 [Terracidiphilus sp.]